MTPHQHRPVTQSWGENWSRNKGEKPVPTFCKVTVTQLVMTQLLGQTFIKLKHWRLLVKTDLGPELGDNPYINSGENVTSCI